MSLSGMFNTGHDVGGFAGPAPDAELLIRLVQNGAFSPRFIVNSWKEDGSVNSPWLYPEALGAIRHAIRLRYRLLPYLYTLYRGASIRSEPILRPLFYEYDDDARAYEDTDDFMVGPNLLVASVVTPGQRERSVYLPRGPSTWVDCHSGMHFEAGTVATVAAPLERVVLFAPAGAMIPMTGSEDFGRLHDEPSRQLRVFPATGVGNSSFTLYEDDGITLAYRDRGFAEVRFELTSNATDVAVRAGGRKMAAALSKSPCRPSARGNSARNAERRGRRSRRCGLRIPAPMLCLEHRGDLRKVVAVVRWPRYSLATATPASGAPRTGRASQTTAIRARKSRAEA